MSEVIDIFKQLVNIPRCSGNQKPFMEYMEKLAKDLGYICLTDEANNILCKKEDSKAKLILQSHYDIVCLVDNTIPKIVQDGDWLKAENSTLGADNGIGCAYMIALMQQGYDGEFLFTSDEEIGLIGANNLGLQFQSEYMLNLDSEDEGEICIGCAGGVDIFATNTNKKTIPNKDNLDLYEISISKLTGGHSGVDIDKNIPNALKLMAKTIKECEGKLLDFNGGERINSIPVNAKAIIATNKTPKPSHENMIIEKLDTKSEHLTILDDSIIDFIYNFQNGIKSLNDNLGVVQTSINLAIVNTSIDDFKMEFSGRSMSNEDLASLKEQTVELLKKHNFTVSTAGKYPAWSPDINDFTNKVLEIYKQYNQNASLEAIHAGLECALFKNKYPDLKVASIGPTIKYPHSKREQVSIQSVENLYKIVKKITQEV